MWRMIDSVSRSSLLIVFCFAFLYNVGKCQASSVTPCEVHLLVQSGIVMESAPGQNVTLDCPVKRCGKRLDVSWCKLGSQGYKDLEEMPNVEITQRHDAVTDDLISSLTFKRISALQEGLYRCALREHNFSEVSHSISISVSDNYTGTTIKHSVKHTGNEPPSIGDEYMPFFYICFGMVLLIGIVTALTYLSFYFWERKQTSDSKKTQEMHSPTQPDLHMTSSPSVPLPQAPIPSACTPQTSDSVTYSVISLKKPGIHAGGQLVATHKSSAYPAISVSLPAVAP